MIHKEGGLSNSGKDLPLLSAGLSVRTVICGPES